MKKDYIYDAVVVSVYDGDTLRANIDLGFDTWLMKEPIRFYGINAPEIKGENRDQGLVSRDWVREKLPVGTKIQIKTLKDKTEKYGRYLGIIYLNDVNINEEMVANNLAVRYMV